MGKILERNLLYVLCHGRSQRVVAAIRKGDDNGRARAEKATESSETNRNTHDLIGNKLVSIANVDRHM